jgi:putative ABC transport system permease protein
MPRLLRKVSLRQLRANWARTVLVVVGIATGLALIVAIRVINASVLANFRDTLEMISGPAALQITMGTGEVGFEESVAGRVAIVPGIAAVIPLVRGSVALASRPADRLELFGMDLTAEEDLTRYGTTLERADEDPLVWLNDPRSIALTEGYATTHGFRLGDKVQMSTPQGVREFTIRGFLQPEGIAKAFDGRVAVMDMPAAQMLLGKDATVDQVDLILEEGADIEGVRGATQALLPSGLIVARPVQRGAMYEKMLASFQALLSGLSLLCLVAGIYIVYNTTSTGALHRSLAMAGLQVAGAEPFRLFALLMIESLALGIVGTGIGLPTGIALAHLLTGMVSESMGIIFQLRFPVRRLEIDHVQLAWLGILSVSCALVSSFFAARKVIQLEPLEILKAGAGALRDRPQSGRLVAIWFAMVAVTACALIMEVQFKSIAWGNFASTLWFASPIVIAVPIVTATGPLLRRVLISRFGVEGRVAAESLNRSPTRTGITVAAIALVVTVAVNFATLARSQRESVKSYFVNGFLASDLAVSAIATEGGWLESPIPARLAEDLKLVPGIHAVETLRILPGHLFRGERIALAGLSDGLFDPGRYPDSWYREGDRFRAATALRAGYGANVSTSLADRFGLTVGDTIQLDSPTGILRLMVVGIVPDYVSDRGIIGFSATIMRERWRDALVNRIHVFVEPGEEIEAVRERILEQLGGALHLKVLSLGEGVEYLVQKIDQAFAFTSAIQLLIVVVTVAGVFDLLLAGVWERRRELAIWQLIGAEQGAVRRSVVIESAVIGALGSTLGVAVGVITALMWVKVNYRFLLGYYLDFHFAVGTAVGSVLLVMSMTTLAGYLAARHATRQSILEGIQTS